MADEEGAVFRGVGHRGVIRTAGVLTGEVVATGAEDGQVCLWRLVESRERREGQQVQLGKIVGGAEREERRFRPY